MHHAVSSKPDGCVGSHLPSTCPTGTTVVNIPTSTSHWISPPGQMTYTIPANCTNLTIQGNTAVSCTGTPGTAGYSCSATDNTVIIDDITANFGVIQINGSSGTTPLVRVTGLTIQNGSGGNKFQGLLLFYSNAAGSQIRMDHNHFNLTTGTSGTGWAGRLNSCFSGVADHNRFDNASPTNTGSVAQGFMNSNTCNSSDPYGDGSWATATGFGGSNFFFYEANDFEGGLFGDCITGGKFVARYNTFNSDSKSSSWIHNHGTAQNGGRVRSCRAFEAYNNYLNPATAGSAIIGDAGGTGLIWGNTLSRTSAVFLAVGDERNDSGHSQSPTPGAWGYCGIGTLNPSGPISNWDENVDSTGRACLDGIGRGFDVQALNGLNFPNALNSITGTIAWPQEYLEPVYAWMNTLARHNGAEYRQPCDSSKPGCLYRQSIVRRWRSLCERHWIRNYPAHYVYRRAGRSIRRFSNRQLWNRVLPDDNPDLLRLHVREHLDKHLHALHLPAPADRKLGRYSNPFPHTGQLRQRPDRDARRFDQWGNDLLHHQRLNPYY